jgi:hypothetical protein
MASPTRVLVGRLVRLCKCKQELQRTHEKIEWVPSANLVLDSPELRLTTDRRRLIAVMLLPIRYFMAVGWN